MTKLLLVRHGQSQANLEKRFAGQTDVPLTKLGFAQAKLTAEYIKDHYDASKVYASDLSRAYETGKSISDLLGIEIIPNKKLREIFAGEWESMTFDDIIATYAKEFSQWQNDCGNSRCVGGESAVELAKRFIPEICRIAEENDGKTIVIATHATTIRVTQSTVETGGLEDMKLIPWVTNASISEYEYDNGSLTLKKASIDEQLSTLATTLPANV